MSWKLVVLAVALVAAAVAVVLVPTAPSGAQAAGVALLVALGTALPSWLKAPPSDGPKPPAVPPLLLLALGLALLGCPGAKSAEAEGLYLAQHLACVERYPTRLAIDACRAGVDVRWGRHDAGGLAVVESSAKDGGL